MDCAKSARPSPLRSTRRVASSSLLLLTKLMSGIVHAVVSSRHPWPVLIYTLRIEEFGGKALNFTKSTRPSPFTSPNRTPSSEYDSETNATGTSSHDGSYVQPFPLLIYTPSSEPNDFTKSGEPSPFTSSKRAPASL